MSNRETCSDFFILFCQGCRKTPLLRGLSLSSPSSTCGSSRRDFRALFSPLSRRGCSHLPQRSSRFFFISYCHIYYCSLISLCYFLFSEDVSKKFLADFQNYYFSIIIFLQFIKPNEVFYVHIKKFGNFQQSLQRGL